MTITAILILTEVISWSTILDVYTTVGLPLYPPQMMRK